MKKACGGRVHAWKMTCQHSAGACCDKLCRLLRNCLSFMLCVHIFLDDICLASVLLSRFLLRPSRPPLSLAEDSTNLPTITFIAVQSLRWCLL